MKLAMLLLVMLTVASAQTIQHGVTLSCTGSTGATFSIYRATVSKGEAKPPLVSGLAACNYTDTTAVIGTQYFYTMTQTVGGVESTPSVEVSAQIVQPPAPSNPSASVQ